MSTIKTTNIQHPSAASAAIEMTAAGGLWLGGGKILQVVRATDGVTRSTTSTSFVDAGISVTITPQKSDSAILLIWSTPYVTVGTSAAQCDMQITDSSNNAVSGAQLQRLRAAIANQHLSGTLFGWSTPATTSAVDYKGRFLASAGAVAIQNGSSTGQLYAIEVSA